MTTTRDEIQLREAIRASRLLQAKVHAMTEEFPREGADLRDKLRAAADRTVRNLELALEALINDGATPH